MIRPSPYITERLDLTFGVEFEFIVRVKTDAYMPAALQLQSTLDLNKRATMQTGPMCLLAAVQHHIMETLRATGVLVNSIPFGSAASHWKFVPSADGQSFMFDERCSLSANSEDLVEGHARFNRWTVSTDGTIDFRNPQGLPLGHGEVEVPIELQTRKLPLSLASLEEVSHVLRLLESQFSIRTNSSTGLHVHIGNAAGTPGQPFWLSTLKNLASLVTVCAPIIEQIHPPWRIDNGACLSPLDCFGDAHADEWELMSKINWIPDIEGLTQFMAGGGDESDTLFDMTPWFAYNFLQVREGGYGTVEFRQHEGTIDFLRVKAWVLFCAGCVRWASKAYLIGVPRLVERLSGRRGEIEEGMNVNDLLRELGLEELVPYYQTRLWAHEEDNEDSADDEEEYDDN